MMPLYGFMEGDTLGLLILAHEEDRVSELAEKLCAAAAVRVRRPSGELKVIHQRRELDPSLTLVQAGLTALERFDVRTAEREG